MTGDLLVYNNGGGTSIGGLVSGTTYFVIRFTKDFIKLALVSPAISNSNSVFPCCYADLHFV